MPQYMMILVLFWYIGPLLTDSNNNKMSVVHLPIFVQPVLMMFLSPAILQLACSNVAGLWTSLIQPEKLQY